MTINEIQDEIIEEFAGFDDWMDKYQLLIDLGNDQEPLDEKYKVESNLIDGCQSRVWLQADYADGNITFTAESDALIVKGIVALLIVFIIGCMSVPVGGADDMTEWIGNIFKVVPVAVSDCCGSCTVFVS